MAGRFKHPVEDALHALPDGVAGWLDHHAAADWRLLGQIRSADDLLKPLGIVLAAGGGDGMIRHEGLR